jgi:hypothetical protein
MHKHTHVIIGEFFRDNRGIASSFAHPFGVNEKIPDSWGRPKASDVNPTGTGKGNPLDQGERMIELVHPIDPSRAREMAENYVELVNELDRRAGAIRAAETNSPHALLAKAIAEHADVSVELISGELTEEKLTKALVEIRQAEVALLQLKGGVEGLLRGGGEK